MKKRISLLLAVVMILTTLATATTVSVAASEPTSAVLTFGSLGTYDPTQPGTASLNGVNGRVYLFSVNQYQWMKFNSSDALSSAYNSGYYRILYQIIDDTTDNNSFMLMDGGTKSLDTFSNLKNSTVYELTPSSPLNSNIVSRFNKGGYSIGIKYLSGNGTLKVKAIYFFTTKAEADQFCFTPMYLGYQTTLAYDSDDQLCRNLRFVAKGCDSTYFSSVGFSVCYKTGENSWSSGWDLCSQKVYKALTGRTSDEKTMETYHASDFDADYLFALAIKKAPTGANIFKVIPYAVLLDGETVVEGTTVIITVEVSNVALTFGANGSAGSDVIRGRGGIAKYETDESAYRLGFVSNAYQSMFNYFVPAFKSSNMITSDYHYVRVFFDAYAPLASNLTLKFFGTNGKTATVGIGTNDTEGYRLSPTLNILIEKTDETTNETTKTNLADRFIHASGYDTVVGFFSDSKDYNGCYKIKGIYFFTSAEDAEAFSMDRIAKDRSDPVAITFGANGNGEGSGANTVFETNSNSYWVDATNKSVAIRPDTGGAITPDHKYVRVLYSEGDGGGGTAGFQIYNNSDSTDITTAVNANRTTGGFVLTPTVTLPDTIVERWVKSGYKNTLRFNAQGGYKVKALYFFTTSDAADAFTMTASDPITQMTFGSVSTVKSVDGTTSGVTLNETDNSYVLTYTESAYDGMYYYFRPILNTPFTVTSNHNYIRILYRYNGTGANIRIRSTGGADAQNIPVSNTNGTFMMTETATLNSVLRGRFRGQSNNIVGFTDSNSGLTCEIAGIFFFKTEEDAENFKIADLNLG